MSNNVCALPFMTSDLIYCMTCPKEMDDYMGPYKNRIVHNLLRYVSRTQTARVWVTKITKSSKSASCIFSATAVKQEGDVHGFLHLCRQISVVDLNISNHAGLTTLRHAQLINNIEYVKLLLTYGANVWVQDVYGFSPLHTSEALDLNQITSWLIVFGADVFSMKQKYHYV